MNPIRVLVVEDSATVRRYLMEALAGEPGITVVGEAADGTAAVAETIRLEPDVVTLDLQLPESDGKEVIDRIMSTRPTPILVVSSATEGREGAFAFELLRSGAVDVMDKPRGMADTAWRRRFVESVRLVSRIKVVTHMRAGAAQRQPPAPPPPDPRQAAIGTEERTGRAISLIAIGASTGGPRAISALLSALPAGFPYPIIVVLHVSESFDRGWRDWLAGQCRLPVSICRHGDALPAGGGGRIILAPSGWHLRVERSLLLLDRSPEINGCRPSIDVLFGSLLPIAPRVLACLLTGMGRDGATGLSQLRSAGARTYAQDEATSIVYGMPKEAHRLGAVDQCTPLNGIRDALLQSALE